MPAQQTAIISLHPDRAAPLAFDLKDILSALGSKGEQWTWWVRNLDWLGEGAEDLCRQVEAAGPKGRSLSFTDLLNRARKVHQTVEGEFLAFPRGLDIKSIDAGDLNLRDFPSSPAELAIVAVDGSYFEVFAKDAALLAPLRKFPEVRDENPAAYF